MSNPVPAQQHSPSTRQPQDETARFEAKAQYGPYASIVGVTAWIALAIAFVFLVQDGRLDTTLPETRDAPRIVMTVVLAALGVIMGATFSAIGFLLCLIERKHRHSLWAAGGMVLGALGVAPLAVVIFAIFRLANP